VLLADAVAFIVARAIDPAVEPKAAPLTAEERAAAQATAGDASSDAAPSGGQAKAPGSLAASKSEDGASTDASELEDTLEDTLPPITIEDPEVLPPPPVPLRIGWAIGAQAALAWQPLPVLAPGVLAHGALRIADVVRIELGVGYLSRQGRALSSDRATTVYFDALQASLGACAVASTAGTELGLCLGSSLALVRADATGLSAGRDRDLPYAALSLGPVLMQPLLGAWALRIALLPQLALVRPRFVLDTDQLVYTAESFGFFGSIGMELRID
jgi:hypothetical protein